MNFPIFPLFAGPEETNSRLFDKAECLGSKSRHGWTKITTFRLRGKPCGDSKYESKCYGTHQACPHSGLTWKGHVGFTFSQKSLNEMKHPTSQQVLGGHSYFSKKYKDQNDNIGKMYPLKRSLDRFSLNNLVKSKDWVTNTVLSLSLIEHSEFINLRYLRKH